MGMNGVVMARYGLKLSQDGATNHINLLETWLALYQPPVIEKRRFTGVQALGGQGLRPPKPKIFLIHGTIKFQRYETCCAGRLG